jgi:BirA family biotin operon repressor/biotin-[acetyl-CoA-carboxylase] ligase
MLMADVPDTTSELAPLDERDLRERLAALPLGQPLIYLPVVGSTNTYAMELARAGAAEGTLVVTDEQPEGRGRAGRVWRSMPRQQALLSLVLRPDFPPQFLVMLAALAVAKVVEDMTGVTAEIKWPNDVLVGGRKLCGILIETGAGADGGVFAVLGIGLNVNGHFASDPELAGRAATLAELAGHDLAREQVVAGLLANVSQLYQEIHDGGKAGRETVWMQWRARLATLGRRVRIAQGALTEEGIAEDVDADGALLLRRDDGSVAAITWGDVS